MQGADVPVYKAPMMSPGKAVHVSGAGPARRLAAGRLAEIVPVDFEPLHRDTALVALSAASLERETVRDFANEIATECARVGIILENRISPKAANAA